MNTILYFAYGSNMSERRLRKRVPSAKVIGTGFLENYRLTFNKCSKKDKSGKCTIEPCKSDRVFGVLFEINKDEKRKLDKVEGACGNGGYEKATHKIEIWEYKCSEAKCDKTVCCATTYQATNPCQDLKPYTWYKQHVLVGAIEQGLPPTYINRLIGFDAKKDCNEEREACELSIYWC